MWHAVAKYVDRLTDATGWSEQELWIGVSIVTLLVAATFLRGFGPRRY